MTTRILFIDDEPHFVSPHIEALKDAGYIVTHVVTPKEAQRQLQKSQFDLIVLDLILPAGDGDPELSAVEPGSELGLQLHQIIRADPRHKRTPILFFTVISELNIQRTIQQTEDKAGMQCAILTKPVLPSSLLIAVRRLIGGSHADAE